ncbi:hypothetical protein C0J52_09937 [Blattella germanica]|nr:hypothetical protein C0J52_09937 [Blattella germanica]
MKLLLVLIVVWDFSEQCPHNCRCTNYKAFCKDSRIGSLPSALPSTTELISMEGDVLPTLHDAIFNRSDLNNLATLRLVNVHIREVESRTFGAMGQLQSLALTNNNNPALKPGAFLGLARLHSLDLSQNALMHLSSGVFEGLPGLRRLNLSLNYIQNIHKGMFDGLRREGSCEAWQARRFLDLSGEVRQGIVPNSFTGIHKIEDGAFEGLHCFTELKIGFYAWETTVSPQSVFRGLRAMRRIVIADINMGPGTNLQGQVNLTHLQVDHSFIAALPNGFLADSQTLTIPRNFIHDLESGCFRGLRSLCNLDLSRNVLTHINQSTFEDLPYLTRLNLSYNRLSTIQDNAFTGLMRLKILDLSSNAVSALGRDSFSHLVSLRELTLKGNGLRSFHSGAFSVLASLKRLAVPYVALEDSTQVALTAPQRIDSLEGPGYFECNSLQVLKALVFIGSGPLVAQNIQKCLNQVIYLKEPTSLEIHHLDDLETLKPLSRMDISSIHLVDSNVTLLGLDSFAAMSSLESLTTETSSGMKVEKRAFSNLNRLKYLKLYSDARLELEPNSFEGLFNLKKLVLEVNVRANESRLQLAPEWFEGLQNASELKMRGVLGANLGPDNFVRLEGLRKLDLSENKIASVSQGAFRGPSHLEELRLSGNDIRGIDAGVFGALCEDDFALTCANLTRIPDFCNTSTALRALRHLDLSSNEIASVHPRAFLGCNQLLTLILSFNKIQTLDFLYTPKLAVLKMRFTKIEALTNTTFRCASSLSDIDFYYTPLRDLSISALAHLRNLESIILPVQKLDCKLRAVWFWLRKRNVRYSFDLDYYVGMDLHVSKLRCNESLDEDNKMSKRAFETTDLLYFRKYIEPVVLIFIFLGGCFGNGVLLFDILRHSDMRTKSNACIAHLAVADILSLVLHLPLSYWDVAHATWDLDETTCKCFIMSKDLVVTLVVFTVLGLSFERFLVVRSSFRLKAVAKDVGPVLILGTVWVYAIVTCIPSFLAATVHDRCLASPPGRADCLQKAWTFQLFMNSLMPVAAIASLNVATAYILKESISKAPGELRNESRYKNRNSVANIVTTLSLVFTLSYVPNAVLRTLVSWNVWAIQEVFWYSFVSYCLFFLHTLFNPFAVFVMGSKYKTHLMKYVRVFIKEKEIANDTLDIKKSLAAPCTFLVNLGKGIAGTKGTDRVDSDEAVRQARQERLKKLQERFR